MSNFEPVVSLFRTGANLRSCQHGEAFHGLTIEVIGMIDADYAVWNRSRSMAKVISSADLPQPWLSNCSMAKRSLLCDVRP